MRKIYYLFTYVLFLAIFNSCSKDNINVEEDSNTLLKNKQELMRETSILLGKVLKDKEIKKEVFNRMNEVDSYGELVSFAYLFDKTEKFKKNELIITKKVKSKDNLFKTAIVKEFTENTNIYKSISKELKTTHSTNTTLNKDAELIATELSDLLVSEELQIFYPYDPEYENDDMTVPEFYVTFDPLDNSLTNDGFLFSDTSDEYTPVHQLTNEFLDLNPVFVIVPIDPCDIPGQPCESTELFPSSVDEATGDYNVDGANLNTTADIPDPWEEVPTLLTYNVNHNLIPETDIITSYIPKIKVRGTSWMGFAGTHQKLRFYRGTADGTVTQNIDGTITASANKYLVKDFRTRRKNVRDKKWLDFNAQFDPDWNMSENTQTLVVFSLHNFSASASFEATAKSGFKIENGEIVPSTEVSGTKTVKITVGSAKYRANTELSRRQVLSTIIGECSTGKTILDNGVYYNVKEVGIVDYYIKHWYTDLTP